MGTMLTALVATHHTRSLALLEQLSVSAPQVARALVDNAPSVDGAVALPTCNRFELYLDAADPEAARAAAVEAIAAATPLGTADVAEALTRLTADEVPHHLFTVAAGLDSMVVGEREISGQIRRAHAAAKDSALTSPALDRLFQAANHAARSVAATTGLGTSGRSVVSVALDLAEASLQWRDARVLLVGTGAMAAAAVAGVRSRGAHVAGVFSPSGRGADFGELYGIDAVGLAQVAEHLGAVDAVVACSGAEGVVLTGSLVASARAGVNTPLTVIDLALHRDVAADVAGVRGVTVVDLSDVSAHAPSESPQAIDDARAIVAEACVAFSGREEARALDPAVVALREHIFALLDAEVARVRPSAGASAGEVEAAAQVEAALRRFARTLLHTPMVQAKELASRGTSADYVDALRALSGISVGDVDGPDAAAR